LFLIYSALTHHIITHPTDISAAAPFSGVFTCSAKGYGDVTITWHRNNGDLPSKAYLNETITTDITTSTLTIPNVSSKDVGKYSCWVSANMIASQSNIATLSLGGY